MMMLTKTLVRLHDGRRMAEDPVAYWTKAAAEYRAYAATELPATTKTLAEGLAVECEAKAAAAAAARAFDT